MQSILAVEVGNITTTAILIEQVKNRYRLVAVGRAPSSFAPPGQDITLGVTEAIRQIEQSTRRILLAPGGWPLTPQSNNRQGVDAYLTVCSAGDPLQLALAGLTQDISLASARRTVAATRAIVTTVLAFEEGPGTRVLRAGPELGILALHAARPQAILLVGGTDSGAEQAVLNLANTLAMALCTQKTGPLPPVLFAGNSAVREKITQILEPFTPVTPVENIRPAPEVERLAPTRQALDDFHFQQRLVTLPGFQKLSNWSKYPVASAGTSFERLITYLGRQNGLNVLGVNPGSGATTVAAHGSGFNGLTVCAEAGVGHGLPALLKKVPVENFGRWLPFAMEPDELFNQLLNKSLYPASVPASMEDLWLEYAVTREAIRFALKQAQTGDAGGDFSPVAPPWNLLIGAGRTLTGAPQPGHAALLLLDGVEPCGVTSLALDISGAAGLLGAVAAVQPAAAVEVAARDTFLNLGTIVAVSGHGVPGKVAVKLTLAQTSPTQGPALTVEVPYGAIDVIPLPPGHKARLEIRPTRHFEIEAGGPGRGVITEIEGGVLGIIVDARGRPLRLPPDDSARFEALQQWVSKLTPGLSPAENSGV